jgi:hypothetical protein
MDDVHIPHIPTSLHIYTEFVHKWHIPVGEVEDMCMGDSNMFCSRYS